MVRKELQHPCFSHLPISFVCPLHPVLLAEKEGKPPGGQTVSRSSLCMILDEKRAKIFYWCNRALIVGAINFNTDTGNALVKRYTRASCPGT
jgi:hypothetical protein